MMDAETRLLAMSPKEFSDYIASRLPDIPEYRPVWNLIIESEALTERASVALKSLIRSVQDQQADANLSPIKDRDWTRRAQKFKRAAIERKQSLDIVIKNRAGAANRANRAWRKVVTQLVVSIAEHRIEIEGGSRKGRPADIALWDALDEIQFPGGGPLSSLAEHHLLRRSRELGALASEAESIPASARHRGRGWHEPAFPGGADRYL